MAAQWKLVVNTVGDTAGNMVYLDGKKIAASMASLDVSAEGLPTLSVSIPIEGQINDLVLETNKDFELDEKVVAEGKDGQ